MQMLSGTLTYQELNDYLRGTTSSLDLPRLISTLQRYQDRLEALTPIIESLNYEPPKRALRKPASWAVIPKKKRKTLALDELRRREGASYAAIAALHTLLSPIRRLPVELLTEIFLHCLPREKFILPSDAGSPLRLMQVCTQWWRVCITSPQLWTSIKIMLPETQDTPPQAELHEPSSIPAKTALLDMWVSRSGDLPFSLSIQNKLLSTQGIQHVFDICARRLQHIKVSVLDNERCILADYEYPQLKTLEIQSPGGLQHASVDNLSNVLTHTPTLQQFTWNSVISPVFRSPPIMLHWRTITHLTLDATITLKHCMHILSMAVNATTIEFRDVFGLPPVPHFPNINLPHLSRFFLSSRHDISRIFEVLTLPRLSHLSLVFFTWSHAAITGLLRRSRCPLQSLDLIYMPLQEGYLTECLEIVQSTLIQLTVQTFEWPAVTDALIDRLTPTPAGDVLCPRLRELSLYNCIACSPGRLAHMVRARLLHGTGRDEVAGGERDAPLLEGAPIPVDPLQMVELYSCDVELEPLTPLRSMGLKLVAYSITDLTVVDVDRIDVPASTP
ncbi:hypothetical protein HYPSUDRAFT_159253 [Hypholoma sublateritium FD-334 SS-4]|uniref:Uncharacterized protein n=1 Tax=Hypholoma sublateritium (strain FD-334 SS-4) TaxID=945553 RepID=A0A0D2PCJ8_HYPSF|nr:hypothetical protein HYPSUDRAFT_159253 [Hypholoma sublateritium FD-334 SS-4]